MSEDDHPPTSRGVVLFINSLLVLLLVRVLWEVPGFRTAVCRDVRFQREVVDVRALGENSAVAVWRDSHGTFWLDRVDRTGAFVWRERIEGHPQHDLKSYAVAANASSVFVRYLTAAGTAVHVRAHARDSGAFEWDAVVETHVVSDREFSDWLTTDVALVATEAIVVVAVSGSQQVKALDARTGHVTASSTYEDEFHDPQRVGDDVVVRGGRPRFSGVTRLGLQGVTVADGDLVCSLGDAEVVVQSTKEAVIMRPLGGNEEVVLEVFAGLVTKCGHYDGKLVALGRGHEDRQLRVLVWTREGRLLSNVALEYGFEHERDARGDREKGTFSGALTRFIPFLAFDGQGVSIVMVDLVEGHVAWRSRASARRMTAAALFHEGSRWVLADQWPRAIAIFDGHTGNLERAIEPLMDIGAIASSDSDASGLWLRMVEPGNPGRASLARFELQTLTPGSASDVGARDITEELRRELGIP